MNRLRSKQNFWMVGLWGACWAFSSPRAEASCISLIQGPVLIDVKSCGRINPEKTFDFAIEQFSFIKELPARERARFMNSYRGLHVGGKVVRSGAVRTGLEEAEGVLNNEDIVAYIPPGNTSCGAINQRRIRVNLSEVCCEGKGEAPCLLNSSYVLKDAKIIGNISSSAGNLKQIRLEKRKEFTMAQKAFSQRDYELAVKWLKKLEAEGQLDTVSKYMLSLAYRKLDRCPASEPYLEEIYKKFTSNQFWAQNEKFVRAGVLLYARCLSVQKKPGEASIVLQSMLSDREKFDAEIRQSLSHPDFGWIRTSKEFQNYKDAAQKSLEGVR